MTLRGILNLRDVWTVYSEEFTEGGREFTVGTLTTGPSGSPAAREGFQTQEHRPPPTLMPDLSAYSVFQPPHLPGSAVSSEVTVPDYTLEPLC